MIIKGLKCFFTMQKYNFHKKNLLIFLIVYLIAPLFFLSESFAQNSSIEYKIKAGYLYNFTKFISWPENELETFNLCILGEDPFGSIIDPIEKRTVKNKPIRLFRLRSITEVKRCQIVYVTHVDKKKDSAKISLPEVLAISSLENILTVGESRQFTESGGMIAFFIQEEKVRLYINLQALRKSGLDVSAKLLEVAEIYEGEPND